MAQPSGHKGCSCRHKTLARLKYQAPPTALPSCQAAERCCCCCCGCCGPQQCCHCCVAAGAPGCSKSNLLACPLHCKSSALHPGPSRRRLAPGRCVWSTDSRERSSCLMFLALLAATCSNYNKFNCAEAQLAALSSSRPLTTDLDHCEVLWRCSFTCSRRVAAQRCPPAAISRTTAWLLGRLCCCCSSWAS